MLLSSSTSFASYEEYIYDNYPIFEKENIKLQLRDSFQHGGLFVTPSIIILNIGDVEIGSDLLKDRIEHELKHYFCWKYYQELSHEGCFITNQCLK